MTYIKKKNIINVCFSQPVFGALIVIVLPLVTFLNCFMRSFQYQIYYGLKVSIADFLIFQKENWIFTIFLTSLFLLFIQNIIHENFNINYVLRTKNRQTIWLSQIIKITIFSFLFSLYYGLCTVIIGRIFSDVYINWNRQESIFYSNTMMFTNTSFITVYLVFLTTCFISIVATAYLFLFLCWVSPKGVLSWLTTIFVFCWDIFFQNYAILAYRVSINYSHWGNQTLWQGITFEVIFLLSLALIGGIYSKRKEFIY